MVKVGAWYLDDGRCQFTVWAPLLKQVDLKLISPTPQVLPMQPLERGYWQIEVDASPGTQYLYRLNGKLERPDPASSYQPEGVHQASAIVDHQAFTWTDQNWQGVALEDYIIYELHVGTFTPEGTFDAIIPRLERLKALGITAIELMPVAQFPGDRNWGYDGVYPYAVQHSYGGVDGLKRLVDACHQHELAVVLDVVYNHVGPEGNYLADFAAQYFNPKYHPIWGTALNFDDSYCDPVREYFLDNAMYWFEYFHIDALRLDAIQGIYDLSAKHFLAALADRTAEMAQKLGRKLLLTAESDLNDVKVIRSQERGGYGLDAQWNDDYHHAVHTLITGEQQLYYKDFGSIQDLEKSLREGFIYSGQYSPDRKRCHGNSAIAEPAYRLIVHSQTHDQVGNRILGERMTKLTSFEGLKLTAGAILLSPFLPFLFMGEEYAEEAPFFYFISHSDQELIAAVRKSKDEEFKLAGVETDSYDPQAPETMHQCRLNWEAQLTGKQQVMWNFYQHLIQLRKTHPALKTLDKRQLKVSSLETEKIILLHRWQDDRQVFYVMNFSDRPITFTPEIPAASWQKLLDSAAPDWLGSGATMPEKLSSSAPITIPAKSFVLYQN
jgi:maltooligosyltrehalose trehalohydrolase